MRDEAIDLCGQINFTRTDAMPLLERDTQFRFTCAGCGNCCRGREDIVLSGYDLWRIAARLISCASGYSAHTSGSASWMAQWFSVRKGQLLRFSLTGASRSTGKWLTLPMLLRQ